MVETARVWSTALLEELLWNFGIYKLNTVLVLGSNVQIGSKVYSLRRKACFLASNARCILWCFDWWRDTHQISDFLLNCLYCVSCSISWLVWNLMLLQKLSILVKKLICHISHCFNLARRLMDHIVACRLIREAFLIDHSIYILSLHFFLSFLDCFNAFELVDSKTLFKHFQLSLKYFLKPTVFKQALVHVRLIRPCVLLWLGDEPVVDAAQNSFTFSFCITRLHNLLLLGL